MKLTNITIENEVGETANIPAAEYPKFIAKELGVKEHVSPKAGTTSPAKLVLYILNTLNDGKDIAEEISENYGDLIERITADLNRTLENNVDKKAEAQKKKDEAEAAKKAAAEKAEKEAAALALVRNEFVEAVKVGAGVAADELAVELKTLQDSLPEGVSVIHKGQGYGVVFAEGSTKETIATTLGYLQQKANNSQAISGQIQFWIGDTITAAVASNVFSTAKEAQDYIAKSIKESTGKDYEGASLAQYQRMADRTPVELRNPLADTTAYLEISKMKLPKKTEKETDDQFKARLKKFESDRANLQSKVASGEIVKRKDVLEPVKQLLIENNLRKPDSDEPVVRLSEQMAILFHTTFALESLVGVHKKDCVVYVSGTDKITVTKEELEEQRSVALANLTNALYTDERHDLKPADFIRGTITTKKKVKVADGADGKPVMEEKNVATPVYPRPFFEVTKEDDTADEDKGEPTKDKK